MAYEYLKDMSKTPLGRGEFDQSMITGINDLQSQYGDLWNYLQQGFDPRVRQQLNNLPGLQNQILQGGYYTPETAQSMYDLVSGKTLAGQGGTLYDMLQEQFAPARNEARGYAASRGLSPTSGAAMSYEGNVAGQQDRAFAEQMVNKYLEMAGLGMSGLGQMGGEQLARQQTAGNLGEWLAQFMEGAQQNRMGIGMNLTQAAQSPLLQQLSLSQNQNVAEMQKPKNNFWGAVGQALPLAASAFFPAAAPALMGSSALNYGAPMAGQLNGNAQVPFYGF